MYYQDGQLLFGNAEWEGDTITSLEQVKSVEDEVQRSIHVKEKKSVHVKLLFWHPFEEV
jgi:hypothetical protein